MEEWANERKRNEKDIVGDLPDQASFDRAPSSSETLVKYSETPTVQSIKQLGSVLENFITSREHPDADRLAQGDHFLFWNDFSVEQPNLNSCQCQNGILQKDGYSDLHAPPDHLWNHRLWAAGSIDFHDAILLNLPTVCHEGVTTIQILGHGACKVTTRRAIYQANRLKLVELRTLIYTTTDLPAGRHRSSNPSGSGIAAEYTPSSTSLFHYSILTSNAHRIHYDRSYTRNVEGYRNTLVQGSLNVTIILRLLANLGLKVIYCDYRMHTPCYADETLQIRYNHEARKPTRDSKIRLYGKDTNELKMTMTVSEST